MSNRMFYQGLIPGALVDDSAFVTETRNLHPAALHTT